MLAAAVFVFCVAYDFVYVRYFKAVVENRAGAAALYSGVITALGLFTVVGVVWDLELAPAVILGHALGCWLAVRYAPKEG